MNSKQDTRNSGSHKPVICIPEDSNNLLVATSLSQINGWLEPRQAQVVRGVAGYCSDTLYMTIVTRIVQGAPDVGVANGRVGICTGDVELRKGGGARG